jgi:hypothetical protein
MKRVEMWINAKEQKHYTKVLGNEKEALSSSISHFGSWEP